MLTIADIRASLAGLLDQIDAAISPPVDPGPVEPDPVDPGPVDPTPVDPVIPVDPAPVPVGSVTVTTATALVAAMKIAKPGDTVYAKGMIGPVTLTGIKPTGRVTLKGAGATLERIAITGCANISVSDLALVPAGDTVYVSGAVKYLVTIDKTSTDITLERLDLMGGKDSAEYNTWNLAKWKTRQMSGILAAGARTIVKDCCLLGLYHGIGISGAGSVGEENRVCGFSGDSLRVTGSNVRMVRNWATDAYVINGNHPDGCQGFLVGSTMIGSEASDNILIESVSNGANPLRAPMQGIGFHGTNFQSIKLNRNIIAGSSQNAWNVGFANGLEATGNVVFTQVGPLGGVAIMRVRGGGGALSISGNFADKFDIRVANSQAMPAKADYAQLPKFMVKALRGYSKPVYN